jgi:uncharacterized iron-regulated membrane protein
MTVHGIVIAFLLLFPWGLVGVVIVGATASAVKRGLAHLHRAGWVRRRGDSVLSPPQTHRGEHPASARQPTIPASHIRGTTMWKSA